MYMTSEYNKQYLEATLGCLEEDLKDLSTWSVYNSDKCLDDIEGLRQQFEELKNKLS